MVSTALTLKEQYNEASDLFSRALLAIREAQRDGRIAPDVALMRQQWLTERFGVVDAERQIAVCRVILRICQP